jgi:hypothetical protein
MTSLVTLIFMACLANDPSVCEKKVQYFEGSLMQCQLYGQMLLADEYPKMNPKWRWKQGSRWTCALEPLKRNENEA